MTSTAIICAGVCLADKKMAAGLFIAERRRGDPVTNQNGAISFSIPDATPLICRWEEGADHHP